MRPIARSVKPWQRIVGARPAGTGGPLPGFPDPGQDSRGAFDDLRRALAPVLVREADSTLLARSSLEDVVGAFAVHAHESRSALGLVVFELEDWKTVHESAGAEGFAHAFASLGQELRRRVRASDELGRLGEAQIAAVLPGCEEGSLDAVAHRLRGVLEARELPVPCEPCRPMFATAWIAAPIGPVATTSERLLEDLAAALERARGAAAS
jgi:GGDEF domain-containing protein